MSTILQSGLGFRREHLKEFEPAQAPSEIDFFEVAPENWMRAPKHLKEQLSQYAQHTPFFAHGLSLSIGGLTPIDPNFIREIKTFLDDHQIEFYSEHLSACSDQGYLYDLLPIPFTEEGVMHVSNRIKQVCDILERDLYLENVSYYLKPEATLSESEFINAVVAESNCKLLLDVNNAYVNGVNHRYDPIEFIQSLPKDRIGYIHVAGHYHQSDDLIIDTHGADVSEPVWNLLKLTYETIGNRPTLLERDFNIPSIKASLAEIDHIKQLQSACELQYA